jgi:hypothetical protein
MALINCKECQKQYSNLAESCPQCGCPTVENIIICANQQTLTAALKSSEQADACAASEFLIRRSKCNPWIAGAITGLVSPFIGGLVWGIRHKSWLTGLAPVLIAGIPYAIIVTTFGIPEGAAKRMTKYGFQITSGLVMFAICRKNKFAALSRIKKESA